MENACFRCKTPIGSGGTFCRECSREVSLEDLAYTHESRRWLVVALYPAWLVLSVAVVPLSALVLPEGTVTLLTTLSAVASLLGLFAFAWALVTDAAHVRRHDDADWHPSRWGYWALAGVCVFGLLLPVPFVAAYHLYRRHQTAGLPT